MRFDVVLTEDAERDLEELYDYIAEHDTPAKPPMFSTVSKKP